MVYETDGGIVTGLSLFSGGAIGEVVFKEIIPGYRTVGYVEIEKYCRDIIRARIRDGILDDAPIFDDVLTFNSQFAEMYAGKVDFISGGFPCTPWSHAGLRLGEADERNLWPATRDAIRIIQPKYAFMENVPGLLAHEYIRTIFGDLAEMRYDCEWGSLSSAECGAPHIRERIWILAYPNGSRLPLRRATIPINLDAPAFQAWARLGKCGETRFPRWDWSIEPTLDRRNVRLSSRVDRLKAVGNAWVPHCVARILKVEEIRDD
jgi:DNA (cytosine-5)-methyltransferase 1